MNSGIIHANANQSSLNNFSVLIYLPQTRNKMITAAKIVHHQHTSSVGLFELKVLAGGGFEYIDILMRERGEECSNYPRSSSAEGTSEELKARPGGANVQLIVGVFLIVFLEGRDGWRDMRRIDMS